MLDPGTPKDVTLGTYGIGGAVLQSSQVSQRFHDAVRTILDGKIDGFNVAAGLFKSTVFDFSTQTRTAPKVVTIPALDPDGDAYIQPKTGPAPTLAKLGLEAFVKASDLTYGRFCVGDSADTTSPKRQLASIIPDPASGSNPGATFKTTYGAFTLDTGGAFDVIQKRNGTEIIRLDGNLLVTPNIQWKSGTSFKGTLDHAITADRTYTFPDLAVNLAGSAAALTNLRVPKGSATSGVIQDSLIADSGSVPSYNGNTIWHAGNDGAGSGLDADLLDGLSSADFSLVTPVDSTFRIIGSADATKKLAFEVDGITTGTTRTKTPTNRDGTLHDSGGQNTWATGLGAITHIAGPSDQSLRITSGDALFFSGSGDGFLHVEDSAAWIGGDFYFGEGGSVSAPPYALLTSLAAAARTYTFPDASGTVWTSGNDGSGSTLDADLLDGSDGTAYALIVGKSTDKTTQTASNGGSYSVAATVSMVFIDASALTAAQNYTINLPSPVTYAGRRITVKISVVGAATSTVTIDPDAGNVEGSATQAWAANVRTAAVMISNGTDWYYENTFLM